MKFRNQLYGDEHNKACECYKYPAVNDDQLSECICPPEWWYLAYDAKLDGNEIGHHSLECSYGQPDGPHDYVTECDCPEDWWL